MDLPEWINLIPDEKLRQEVWEKAKDSIVPKGDFTKYTQERGEELKRMQGQLQGEQAKNQQFSQWYHNTYEPWLNQVQPLLQNQANGASAAQAQAASDEAYANWHLMEPQQQAQIQHDQLRKSYQNDFRTWADTFAKGVQDVLTDRERYYQNYLRLYVDANEKKRSDPDLDITKYMDRALNLGAESPTDVAYTLETLDREKQRWLEDGRLHGRQEAEEEYKAKAPAAPASPSSLETYKPTQTKQADRMEELKNKVTEKFGPDVWQQ